MSQETERLQEAEWLEDALLGSILHSGTDRHLADPEIFFRPDRRIVAKAIAAAGAEGGRVDVASVAACAKGLASPVSALLELYGVGAGYGSESRQSFAARLRSAAATRRARSAAYALARIAPGADPEQLVEAADALKASAQEAMRSEDPADTVQKYAAELAARGTDKGDTVNSGYQRLDSMLGGFGPGRLTVLAARPKVGKSMLAINIARRAANIGTPVVIYSLEMRAGEVLDSLAAQYCGINSHRIRQGDIEQAEIERISAKLRTDAARRIRIVDKPRQTVQSIAADAGAGKERLVIIDNLNLLRCPDRRPSRYEEVTDITRELKLAAKELKASVLCIAHLNRSCEARENKRPILSDLRDSGSIEQDADTVLFLYREAKYTGIADSVQPSELIVAANRGAPEGVIDLSLNLPHNLFEEAQHDAQ